MTPASNAFHATTDPDLLTRLREMLDSSARSDIAVGYSFMSGFEAVADSLSHQNKVRILVGRADRPVLESVALGLQQSEALRARLEADGMVQRRQREAIAREAVEGIATGVNGAEILGHCGGVMVAHLYYARDSSVDCNSHQSPTRPLAGWSSG